MKTQFDNVTHHVDSPLGRLTKGVCCAVIAGAPLLFGIGCNDAITTDAPAPVETTQQGIVITSELYAASDAEAFRFEIDRVSCADGSLIEADVEVAEKSLEDMLLPGGIPTFENKPYDEDSGHLFADHYTVLDAGCYDVTTTPLQSVGGADSEDCSSASAEGVEVFDGKTTEIHMISQCGNDPVGGLDVIASLNHAPQIESLVFQPSKFTKACVPTTVCVTASDPDGDPLEFQWTRTSGDAAAEDLNIVSTTENGNSMTQCAEIVANTPNTYEYEVTVFDLLHDEDTGDLIRFEDYYDNIGEDRESRDSLEFPVHVGEGDDTCTIEDPDEGECPDCYICTNTCNVVCVMAHMGAQYADMNVTFGCGIVDVWASLELSNVVLLYTDGDSQKFDNLSGHTGTFGPTGAHAGSEIDSVYVKAGAYLSGDGPGWGKEFSADACNLD